MPLFLAFKLKMSLLCACSLLLGCTCWRLLLWEAEGINGEAEANPCSTGCARKSCIMVRGVVVGELHADILCLELWCPGHAAAASSSLKKKNNIYIYKFFFPCEIFYPYMPVIVDSPGLNASVHAPVKHHPGAARGSPEY